MAQALSSDNGASREPFAVAALALYAGVMFGPLLQLKLVVLAARRKPGLKFLRYRIAQSARRAYAGRRNRGAVEA
jgi:hypothetical protein